MNRRELGALGEKLAANFLAGRGFSIVCRNFRCKEGEMDIIARQGDCLVFVEVRTRTSSDMGTPEESITPVKSQRLAAVAEAYLQEHEELSEQWRIDVVAVDMDRSGKVRRMELIENAIGN